MVRRALATAALLLLMLLSPLQALAAGRAGSQGTPTASSGSVAPVGQETSREGLSLLAASPLIVPTPGSCAPSTGSGGPLGAIGQFIGKVTDGIPIIGDINKVVGLVGSVLGLMVEWVGNPSQMVHDVGGWLLWNLLGYNIDQPYCYSPTSPYGFFRSVALGDVILSASSIYSDAYNALAVGSLVLVLLAGMLRVVRGMSDPETRSEALIVDVVIRVLLGCAGIYVGFPVLAWLLPAISSVGGDIFGALLGIMGAPVVRDPLGVLLYTAADPLLRLGLIGLVILPFAIWFMARVIGLLIMRFLIVVFGVMFLPLLIAVAVYDPKHKAVRWWAEALGSAAIIPIVTACLFGGTLGLAVRFGMGDPSDGLFSYGVIAELVVAIGGLWLTGKVLRALLMHEITDSPHPMRQFMERAMGMAMLLPAAASGLLTGPAGAAIAYSTGGVGGLAVTGAAQRLRQSGVLSGMGKSGSGAGSSSGSGGGAGAGGGAGSPAQVLQSFRSSAAGAQLAQAATPDMPSDRGPAERWTALAADEQIQDPMQRLNSAVLAQTARTGETGVPPAEAQHFVRAATASRAAMLQGLV
jgi:hypothetical protein